MARSIEIIGYSSDRLLVEDPEQQKNIDEHQLVSWLLMMGPWEVIAHFTWRDRRVAVHRAGVVYDRAGECFRRHQGRQLGTVTLGASEWTCQRAVQRFMNDLPGVSYFYSVEKNPSRDGHHVHALWGDCRDVFRREQWSKWVKLHGRARIEPVRGAADVAGYASKYVMKVPCWWNVKLRWHRLRKLQGDSSFVLERESAPPADGVVPGALLSV